MAFPSPSSFTPLPNHHTRSIFSHNAVWRSITNRDHQFIRILGGIHFRNGGFRNKINVYGEAEGSGIEASSAVKDDLFVRFFRAAWPYFLAHRGSTFVVVISAEIIDSSHFDPILMDISLLHGLGIKFVIIPGTHVQIDRLLAERGCQPKYVGRYRITDTDALTAAMDAAGRIRIMIEAKLSPGPSLSCIRRHGDKS